MKPTKRVVKAFDALFSAVGGYDLAKRVIALALSIDGSTAVTVEHAERLAEHAEAVAKAAREYAAALREVRR